MTSQESSGSRSPDAAGRDLEPHVQREGCLSFKHSALARGRCIPASPVEEVTNLDFGRYVVVTGSLSTYVVEVDAEHSTLVRTPAHGAMPGLQSTAVWESVTMRRDKEFVPLLDIIRLRVGHRAIFRIDVRRDGVETTRTTTPVSAINKLQA